MHALGGCGLQEALNVGEVGFSFLLAFDKCLSPYLGSADAWDTVSRWIGS